MAGSPDRVFGIDFSGSAQAGRGLWIARGLAGPDALEVESCQPASSLPGSGPAREQSLRALRELIAGEKDAIFGLDFPFGLPATLMGGADWKAFLDAFPDRYPDEQSFRTSCFQGAGRRELMRLTDSEAKAPFSPYNLKMYRQTYFGIRDVLRPLVREGRARVLPMQGPADGAAWLLEICPASTLKAMGLYRPYKGGGEGKGEARKALLAALEEAGSLTVPDPLRARIVEQRGGDALDSVVAALAVFRALQTTSYRFRREHLLEGYVFV